jgi:hypothetical protein
MKTSKFLIFTVLFCLTINLSGLFVANESENAYTDNEIIERLIIDGAGYFLKSHSDFIYFLQKIEIGEKEFDYLELNSVLRSALDNLEKANAAYNELYNEAKFKSYNYVIIDKLLNFDYTNYREKIKTIPSIYGRVQSYLSGGDVTGLYLEICTNTSDILTLLYEIKKDIEAKNTSEKTKLWRVTQKYMQVFLFGQYTAEIFFNL